MHQSLVKRPYSLDRHAVCQELLSETVIGSMLKEFGRILALKCCVCLLIGLYHNVPGGHTDAEFRKVTQTAGMDNQRVKRITYAHTAGLGVEYDIGAFLKVSLLVKIGVADSGAGLYTRYLSLLAY